MAQMGNTKSLAAFVALMRLGMVSADQSAAAAVIFAVCFADEFKEMNDDWREFFTAHRLDLNGQPLPG
jgi:hypothetical protein